MKIDLHLHSEYSWDSFVPIKQYIESAEKLSFGAISITDHNSTDSHSVIDSLQTETEVMLIPGQEVSTANGHLLVYGWIDSIESGLSMRETIEIAKKRNGFCIAAHPFDPFRKGSYSKVFETGINGIEILNASSWLSLFNWMAKRAHSKYDGFAGVANSDSHRIEEFGNAFTIIEDTSSHYEVLEGLKSATIGGSRIGIYKKLIRLAKRKF